MIPKVFKTAIIGLGRTDVAVLHQLFSNILNGCEFRWVTAEQPNIDFLLINNHFINSTSIQRLIHQRNVPYLVVDHKAAGITVENNILHLPVADTESLLEWLKTNLMNVEPDLLAADIAPPPISVQHHSINKSTLSTASQSSHDLIGSSGQEAYYTADLLSTVKKINDLRGSQWILSCQDQPLGIIDISRQLIWCPKDFQFTQSGALFSLTMTRINKSLSHYLPYDLKRWLFNLIWHYKGKMVYSSQCPAVELTAWPQLYDADQQRKLLDVCAYLKQQATSINGLMQLFKQESIDIERLVTALISVEFAQIKDDIHQSAQAEFPSSQPARVEEKSILKGFLSKLRGKLGL